MKSCELELVIGRERSEISIRKRFAASEVSLEVMPLKQEHNYRLSILK